MCLSAVAFVLSLLMGLKGIASNFMKGATSLWFYAAVGLGGAAVVCFGGCLIWLIVEIMRAGGSGKEDEA
jgi:hypothetical protein